jgi:3-oxoacyl-[acyl-carrier protein] reductase
MDLKLRGKVALVTGGSRGIGRAIALRLAEEGADVAICGRTQATIDSTLETLRGHGTRVHGVIADVMQPGEVERFVGESTEALGGADLVVANVGGSTAQSLLEATPEDWISTFEMNLFHAARMIKTAVPHMERRGGGSAVIISSISGWRAGPGALYGSVKAAEIFLAGQLAWELAEQRIRVNTVSPGSILFPGGGWAGLQQRDPDRFNKFAHTEFPWERLGTAEEIANVVAFILSEQASWVNGANIPVDGGQAWAGVPMRQQ